MAVIVLPTLETNPQHRADLSRDVQRHILESMQTWRSILNKYSSKVQDIKLRVESNIFSREYGLKEITFMLGTFHAADARFEKYRNECIILFGVHIAEIVETVEADFNILVQDWINLKVTINSLHVSFSTTAEVEVTKVNEEIEVEVTKVDQEVEVEVTKVNEGVEIEVTKVAEVEVTEVEVHEEVEDKKVEVEVHQEVEIKKVEVLEEVEVEKVEVEEEVVIMPIEVEVVESTPEFDYDALETEVDLLDDNRKQIDDDEKIIPPKRYNNLCFRFFCCGFCCGRNGASYHAYYM